MSRLVQRIALLPVLMLLISFIAFALVRVAPGGPFDRERTPASPEVEKALRAKYHLDEPLWKQYLIYLSGLIRGDLGPSMKYRNHTVNDILAQGLPITLSLGLAAFFFALAVGVVTGVLAAFYRGTWIDWLGNGLALVAICVPAFVVGPVLILVFAIQLEWFPVARLERPVDLVLPAVTLGIFFAGRVARLTREGMLSTLNSEFITAARAKGLGSAALVVRHALRLALLPVLSYSGPLLTDLLTGSFVVENLFQIPGIGVFLVNSSLNRDYTMVVGLVLLYAAILLVLNLLVDLSYRLLDPRVRYE